MTMKIDDVDQRFLRLLREAQGDPSSLAPEPAWHAFIAFAHQLIEGLDPSQDQDRLLFEAVLSRPGIDAAPVFAIDIERQYTIEVDGQYEGMRHLLCSFTYALTDELAGLAPAQLWGCPGDEAGEWVDAVQRTDAFTVLQRERPATATFVAGSI